MKLLEPGTEISILQPVQITDFRMAEGADQLSYSDLYRKLPPVRTLQAGTTMVLLDYDGLLLRGFGGWFYQTSPECNTSFWLSVEDLESLQYRPTGMVFPRIPDRIRDVLRGPTPTGGFLHDKLWQTLLEIYQSYWHTNNATILAPLKQDFIRQGLLLTQDPRDISFELTTPEFRFSLGETPVNAEDLVVSTQFIQSCLEDPQDLVGDFRFNIREQGHKNQILRQRGHYHDRYNIEVNNDNPAFTCKVRIPAALWTKALRSNIQETKGGIGFHVSAFLMETLWTETPAPLWKITQTLANHNPCRKELFRRENAGNPNIILLTQNGYLGSSKHRPDKGVEDLLRYL